MKVYLVVRWYTPWLSHGYEPQRVFLSKARAQEYANAMNLERGIIPLAAEKRGGAYHAEQDEYEVDEWEVEE